MAVHVALLRGINVGIKNRLPMKHVAFLAATPTPAMVATLDPDRSPPDESAVRGREIYLRLPNGVARSRLTNAFFDSRLGTTSTLRNWRTVLKLVELT
jgi:uncharacterized protein (DUF1697 family)